MRQEFQPRIEPMNRRSTPVELISTSSILLASECSIYRVAKYRAAWPFSGHELTRSRCLKYPRPEARSRPQPRRACPTRKGQPWSYGQGRKFQIRGLIGFARENSGRTQCRPCRTLLQTIGPNRSAFPQACIEFGLVNFQESEGRYE